MQGFGLFFFVENYEDGLGFGSAIVSKGMTDLNWIIPKYETLTVTRSSQWASYITISCTTKITLFYAVLAGN